jgi:hypothetical protein
VREHNPLSILFVIYLFIYLLFVIYLLCSLGCWFRAAEEKRRRMASSLLLGWTVRAASGGDAPKEELLNRGHVPVSGDIAYLHTQRAVHFIDFGAPPLLCSLLFPPPFLSHHLGIIPRHIPCVCVCPAAAWVRCH